MHDRSWTGDSLRYLLPRGDRRRDAWAEEAAEGNRRGGQRLLDAGEVQPPPPVREALRLGEGERAVSRRRLVLLDDVPIEIATSYYPARIAGGTPLAERRKVPGGAVTFLAELGWVAHRVEEAEGLLIGRPGKGVFVRDEPHRTISLAAFQRPTPQGQPDSWVSEAARQGRTGATRILEVAEVWPPRDVAAALGAGEDGTTVLRSRVMLLDGEPAELVHSYYPSDLALGTRLADRRRIPGGSPTLLASMGYPPVEFVDRVSVRPPTSEEFTALELPAEDVCVLCVFRVVYSVDDRPIEVSVMVKAGHLYELEYRALVRE